MMTQQIANSADTVSLKPVMPEAVFGMMLVLPVFIAFCVMVGLHWSIKSKGTIGSVIIAVGTVLAVVGVISLCAIPAGKNLSFPGSWIVTMSPINLVFAYIYPNEAISSVMSSGVFNARVSLIVGALVTVVIYSVFVYGMHTNMRRTFMMTVRRLAGAN